jgi:hypothetical protein
MSHPAANGDRLLRLSEAVCDKTASPDELAELDSLLRADSDACWRYLSYCELHFALGMELRAHRIAQRVHGQVALELETTDADSSGAVMPPIATISLPDASFPTTALPGTIAYFSSGWPVAYSIATLILGVGLLIGAVTHVSRPEQVVQNTLPAPFGTEAGGDGNWLPSPFGRGAGGEGSERLNSPSIVGQITGTFDCQFAADSKTEDQRPKSPVIIGEKFRLLSGLLEITYNTGARVILQGPVTYKVESPVGGFLSVGKLTARVENTKTQDLRPKTQDPNPKSPNLQISKFIVRTPTATVTDLGTEFGVEVAKSGETTSHVFRGSVSVQMLGHGGVPEGAAQVLRENQTARVERSSDNRQIVTLHTFAPSHFIREIPRHIIKTLDLVDVVAGGDGFSGRRNRGIDVTNGRPTDKQPPSDNFSLVGDGKYHRAQGMPFVDGVFVPDGRSGHVQVDSAGHLFEGFPESPPQTALNVWAGGAVPAPSTFIGPTQDSAEFSYKYEMDVLPSAQDLDGNSTLDFSFTGTAWSLSNGIATITTTVDASSYVDSVARAEMWPAQFGSGPLTLEWRAKVVSSDATGAIGVFAANHCPLISTILADTYTQYESTRFPGDNTDAFHVFRLAKTGIGAASKWYFWRDGVLLVDGLAAAREADDLLVFGDGSSLRLGGTTQVDYFRITTGAYAPVSKLSSRRPVIPAKLAGVDYASPGHGVLWLLANKGITFDLEAIRRANPGSKAMQFQAVTGNLETCSESGSKSVCADIWVLVDGKVRFQRREINRSQGAYSVMLPIGKNDRFLTLAATDGGDGTEWDWIIFGDPRLELLVEAGSAQDAGGR